MLWRYIFAYSCEPNAFNFQPTLFYKILVNNHQLYLILVHDFSCSDGILFGMGNPLLDISAHGDQEFLDKYGEFQIFGYQMQWCRGLPTSLQNAVSFFHVSMLST